MPRLGGTMGVLAGVIVPPCLFVSDLHGRPGRWRALFAAIERERPAGVFLGGDLFPGALAAIHVPTLRADSFARDVVLEGLARLRDRMGTAYPSVYVVLGNDDGRFLETTVLDAAIGGIWTYVHDRRAPFGAFDVYGYSYIPPSPFALKDWERYDVSRFVDPGATSPEEGRRTVPVDARETRFATIAADLERLTADRDLGRSVFLFHCPPYDTALDRAALDGRTVDHVPLDVHVGSIAIRRFLERRGPRVSLHGHVHESARLTGAWRERVGRTWALGAAHDGDGLALVRFDPEDPERASREIVREVD